jgi:23S rRNA (cytosine1962-C5)-methyltransferase
VNIPKPPAYNFNLKNPDLNSLPSYALVDSGDGKKLEKFGDILLIRPSKRAIWSKNCDTTIWNRADAEYILKKDTKNISQNSTSAWKILSQKFEIESGHEWYYTHTNISMILRLQRNGQIGLFPEHSSYDGFLIESLEKRADSRTNEPLKVLNLFAYTGWSSLICLKQGAHVTHVDNSRQVLEWARQNFEKNGIETHRYRFILEDALSYVKKEVKRGKKYDLIIADPPSFSWGSGKTSWDLEDIVKDLMYFLCQLIEDTGSIVYASHSFEVGPDIVHNLISHNLDNQIKCMKDKPTIKYFDNFQCSNNFFKREGFYILLKDYMSPSLHSL